ncbi:MAG TPA: hypothetical protein VMW83_12660 [Spirochaetia bacterium]|nr:hypothetical protein [Spirochaetia bacterium]
MAVRLVENRLKRTAMVLLAAAILLTISTVNCAPSPVKVVAISASGDGSAYVLKSDGSVWAWGSNAVGQLGNGSINYSPVPVKVQGLTGVTAIAAGLDSAYALKSDGTGLGLGGQPTRRTGY